MPPREPLWFCHECHAEMRPLMVPGPTCASCHGSFVEKMENPSDDPREFQHAGPGDLGLDDMPPDFLLSLRAMMNRGPPVPHRRSPPARRRTPSPDRTRVTFQVRSNDGLAHTYTFGGPNTLNTPSSNASAGQVPTMHEFIGGGPDVATGPAITRPMMLQYLMALLGQHEMPLDDLFLRGMGDTAADRAERAAHGRYGDYVFNQEALDQIITQLMENSNTSRPVAATEEIIEKLPREVLEENSPTLEKDCAVCKDQFKLGTEDPDEQVVVTLPCHHPFHETCILPWLKSSGTCPVCRYALIPQPDQHAHDPHPTSPTPGGSNTARPNHARSSSRSQSQRPTSPGRSVDPGFFQNLFGHMSGNNPSTRGAGNSGTGGSGPSRSSHTSPNSSSRRPARPSDPPNRNIPGGWAEDLD